MRFTKSTAALLFLSCLLMGGTAGAVPGSPAKNVILMISNNQSHLY